MGYNGVQAVTFVYRHVKFEEKEFLVGELFATARGDEARQIIEEGGTAISGGECNSAVEVIFSITGEKVDPDRHPCELRAFIPSP